MTSKILNIMLIVVATSLIGYYVYHLPKFKTGQKAPDFSATLLSDETFQLSDLNGQYILLDFWGSWCGPCRRENPELVTLNNKYASANLTDAKGFKIVSIGIEKDTASWKNAIKTDHLQWKHHIIQGERFKSPIAQLYGITWIPTKYLLSPDGEILISGKDLSDIDRYLAEKLKN